MLSIVAFITLTVAAAAAAIDVVTRRIPNPLTFGAALAALLYHTIDGGLPGFGLALGGWCIGAALFLPFFALGGMGAGDVKLVGAIGACLGPLGALHVAAGRRLPAGPDAVVVMLRARYFATAVANLRLLLRSGESTESGRCRS